MKPLLLICCTLLSALAALNAEVIRTCGFEADDLAPAYPVYFTRGGAESGSIFLTPDALSGRRALAVVTPDEWSWAFLINAFGPGELRGKKLRASCWMKTNRPESAALVLTEGFVYGESGLLMKFAHPEEAGRWEFVSAEWEIQDAEHHRFSVGVGHDYGAEKSWTIIDDLTIECGDELPPLPQPPPRPSQQTDRRVLSGMRGIASEVSEVLADLAARPVAGFDPADRQRELESFLQDEAAGVISLEALGDFERFLETARDWRLGVDASADTLASADPSRQLPLAAPEGLTLSAAGNQRVGFLLHLRNRSRHAREAQLKPEGFPPEAVEIRRLVDISGAPDYLAAVVYPDSLTLGAGETTSVLVRLDTACLPPGKSSGALRVIPFDAALPVIELPVELMRYAIELPEETGARVFNWDYNSANDATPERLQALLKARVNVFNIDHLDTSLADPDFSVIERWVANFRRIAGADYRFQLQLESYLPRQTGGWKPEYNPWLDRLVAATRAAGLGYEDWNLHIYDENLSDEFLDAARQIKAHNPQVRIFSDKVEADPERMRNFAACVDFWCPLTPALDDPQYAAGIAVMRESGHPILTYQCEPAPMSSLADYRLMPWRAWHHRLQGFGNWAFIPNRQRHEEATPNFGFFYYDASGLAPSRRWTEWEAGIEDYLLLETVAARAPELRALADRAAAEVCAAGPSEAGTLIGVWRERLLQAASR